MNKINKILAKHDLRLVRRSYVNGHSDLLISPIDNNVTTKMTVVYCSGDFSNVEKEQTKTVQNAIYDVLKRLNQ